MKKSIASITALLLLVLTVFTTKPASSQTNIIEPDYIQHVNDYIVVKFVKPNFTSSSKHQEKINKYLEQNKIMSQDIISYDYVTPDAEKDHVIIIYKPMPVG